MEEMPESSENDDSSKDEWMPGKERVLYSSIIDNELMEVRMLGILRGCNKCNYVSPVRTQGRNKSSNISVILQV